jgi:hypothetical protein
MARPTTHALIENTYVYMSHGLARNGHSFLLITRMLFLCQLGSDMTTDMDVNWQSRIEIDNLCFQHVEGY